MRMMLLILMSFLTPFVWAQIDIATDREKFDREKAKRADSIRVEDYLQERATPLTFRYFSGPVLVYDCRDRHFICTSMLNAIDCRDQRDNSINLDRFELPCVPIKKYNSDEECIKEQYKRMHQIADLRWCYNNKKLGF